MEEDIQHQHVVSILMSTCINTHYTHIYMQRKIYILEAGRVYYMWLKTFGYGVDTNL